MKSHPLFIMVASSSGRLLAFLLGKGSRRTLLAAAPFDDEIFRLLEFPATNVVISSTAHSVEWHIAEGDEFEPIKHVATVRVGRKGPLSARTMQRNCYRVCLVGYLLAVKNLMGRVAAPSMSRTWHRAMASAASSQAHARQRLMCIRHYILRA